VLLAGTTLSRAALSVVVGWRSSGGAAADEAAGRAVTWFVGGGRGSGCAASVKARTPRRVSSSRRAGPGASIVVRRLPPRGRRAACGHVNRRGRTRRSSRGVLFRAHATPRAGGCARPRSRGVCCVADEALGAVRSFWGLRSRHWLRGVCRIADSWRQAFEWTGDVCRVAVSVRQAVKRLGETRRGGGVVVDARVMRSAVGRWCGTHTALLLVSLSSGGKWRGRRSAAGAARRRRCFFCRCRRGASGVVFGRPRVRRARGGASRVVVVWAQVVWSSVRRGCGAHTAQLLVSLTLGGKWRGRRSAAGTACTRRCCSCRCRLGASRVVFGRPLVRRAHGATACVVVVGGQVAWSSLGRGCGAQAALLLLSLSTGRKWRGRRSAAAAACTRRCCSCRCRLGASRVVFGRPLVRRAHGATTCVVDFGGQVAWSLLGRGCGAQAALLHVSLSLGRK